MPQNVPFWWTDQRVQETVDSQYIHSHLRPDEQLLLKKSLSFGAGLTDDTYLDWILTRAKRLFLILVDTGVPDQIFGVVDDSYDDDDLPIAEDAVQDLRLSLKENKSLDKRFYKTQFRYLIRILGDSEHIRYAQEETVPVYPLGLKAAVLTLGKDGTDKVWLPSNQARVFTRKRIALDKHVTEHGILSEIASNKKYAHQHVVSVFGSYLFEESVYILLTPPAEYNLKSFLSDVPKAFDNLPKQERRQILIGWPHCLAKGLAWLHSNSRPHGAVRPSNVLIDERSCILLGSFSYSGSLDISPKADDIEAYQYAAPERWKRTVTMQTTGPARMAGHSGGRTARKVTVKSSKSDGTDSKRSSWTARDRLDTAMPTATSYAFMPTSKSNFSRLQLGRSDGDSIISVNSTGSGTTRGSAGTVQHLQSPSPRADTPSAASYASSGSNRAVKASMLNPIFVAAPEMRTAVVQTWQSAQYDLFAADMFSLSAVILGILTLLCKRSASSFERHRSSKNRTAGRGGGLADASFHANIGQVEIWANMLQEDAKKRAKKEEGAVFKAVSPILRLVNQCLSREPDDRLTATQLKKRLEECILSFAGLTDLHCPRELSSEEHSLAQEWPTELPQHVVPMSHSDEEITQAPPRADEWAKLRSKGLVTATIPNPSPAMDSSMSSLSSFNFDYDMQSETVVEDDRSHITKTMSDELSRPATADAKDVIGRSQAKAKQAGIYNNWHENDSAVDPSLCKPPTSLHGGLKYSTVDYSSSLSSEAETDNAAQRSFYFTDSRPTSIAPAPERPLPPVPDHTSARSGSVDIRPEAFPVVPRKKSSTKGARQRAPQLPELNIHPRTSSLHHHRKAGSELSEDPEWQIKSPPSSNLPHRPRTAQKNGASVTND